MAAEASLTRKIIHCDCDSFYASVEMRDNPALRDQPIAVGGSATSRGVVATCNYAARKFGVHSAMPMATALRLCPALVVVKTNMSKYRDVSAQVHEIFSSYTELIEPLSLDEAFLDVTNNIGYQGSATLIAEEIRQRVRQDLGITISAGIAPNKFLAKIASDWNKPDGIFTIAPAQVAEFVRKLPVKLLFGVGEVTANKMQALDIVTCEDLSKRKPAELTTQFGKFGVRLHQLSQGIDNRPVVATRQRKSISVERTYAKDLPDKQTCLEELAKLMPELKQRINKAQAEQKIDQCTVKVRFAGFETTTASKVSTGADEKFFAELFNTAWQRGNKPVRLIGLAVHLVHPLLERQLELFSGADSNTDSEN